MAQGPTSTPAKCPALRVHVALRKPFIPHTMSIVASTMPVHARNHAHSASLQIERGHCPHQQIANEVKPQLAPNIIRATDRWHPIRTTSWQVRCMLPSVVGLQSCLCGDEHAAATRSCQSSAARAPHPSCAHSPRGIVSARHLHAQPAAYVVLHRTHSTRCVVSCLIDGCERALESTLSRVCRYQYICK